MDNSYLWPKTNYVLGAIASLSWIVFKSA